MNIRYPSEYETTGKISTKLLLREVLLNADVQVVALAFLGGVIIGLAILSNIR